MNLESQKVFDDFENVFKNSLDIVIAKGQIGMGHIRRKKSEPIFFDAIWGCLVFDEDDSGQKETVFFHIKGSRPVIAGKHSWRIRFAWKPIAAFIVECDDEMVAPEHIRRVNIYARTDIGTIVLSKMPPFEREARVLVAGITKDANASQLIQQLAMGWLHEFLGKSTN